MAPRSPPFSPIQQQHPRALTTPQLNRFIPIAQMQQHAAKAPCVPDLSVTVTRTLSGVARDHVPGLQPPSRGQPDEDQLRSAIPAGQLRANIAQHRGTSDIGEAQRATPVATGPSARFDSNPLQPPSRDFAPWSSSHPLPILGEREPKIRKIPKSQGRKRPAVDAAATSTGRKSSNEFPPEVVKRAKKIAHPTHRVTRHDVHSSPLSSEDDVPSSQYSVHSVRRGDYKPELFGGLKDDTPNGTPSQDTPQPSIETPHAQAIRIRQRPIVSPDEDTNLSIDGPLSSTLRARPSTMAQDPPQSLSNNMRGISQAGGKQHHEYMIPDELKYVKEALGNVEWTQYMELMEKFVEGKLSEADLNREERILFHVQGQQLRSRIRRLVNEMVAESRLRDDNKHTGELNLD